jgi:PTH1 family peptidyl-tRNA hydrolase
MTIKLIVGLRNPGDRYAKTRHNVGAWVLEALTREKNLTWLSKKEFFGEVAELSWTHIKTLALLPNTFMNLSGQSVSALSRFYRYQPEEILVIHDDLDLAVGTIKLKKGGGHGGHNGLQDIIRHLGSPEFYRLRIGIGHPGDKSLVSYYVLHPPSAAERVLIEQAIAQTLTHFPEIVQGNVSQVMNELHRR